GCERLGQLRRGRPLRFGPTARRRPAVLDVDPTANALLAESRDRRPRQRRALHRCRAQDHARGARVQRHLRRAQVADSTAHLDLGGRGGLYYPSDQIELSLAAECSVEIDDVQRLRALLHERARLRGGILGVHPRALPVAFVQPHRPPLEQVDRGIEQGNHAPAPGRARNLLSNASPSCALFSGWYCTPKSVPWPTTAAMRTGPCSATAQV